MIIGIGIDIIEIERIKKSVDSYDEKFLNKIYTKRELDYCLSKPNKYQHLAARFAAKEAVYKAISSISGLVVGWKNIEIFNEPNGMPVVKLSGKVKEILSHDRELKISISHSRDYVACVAIVYKND
jgi:holo-[acyl-carrier protein] synthase